MKIYLIAGLSLLAACTSTITPNEYVANMYAKGELDNYQDTGVGGCSANGGGTSCPGCHVKRFDRVKLTVDEVLVESERMAGRKVVDGCQVEVEDSLHLMNISEQRYIPAAPDYTCKTVYEKEKAYLKAMGFQE